MKYSLTNLALAATLVALAPLAAQTSKAGATKAAAKSSATAEALPPGIPAGAKPYKSYYWRWVDPKTKKAFIYHTTPFGVVKDEETDEDRAEMAALAAKERAKPTRPPGAVTVIDKGEELEFTRDTPFGKSKWTAKKSALNDEEAAIWEESQAAAKK